MSKNSTTRLFEFCWKLVVDCPFSLSILHLLLLFLRYQCEKLS